MCISCRCFWHVPTHKEQVWPKRRNYSFRGIFVFFWPWLSQLHSGNCSKREDVRGCLGKSDQCSHTLLASCREAAKIIKCSLLTWSHSLLNFCRYLQFLHHSFFVSHGSSRLGPVLLQTELCISTSMLTWGWSHFLPLMLSILNNPVSGDSSVMQTFFTIFCSASHSVIPEQTSVDRSKSRRGK